MTILQLIYVSTMQGDREGELGDILASAVRHNEANGITGMLLYYRGGFMQVLEGEEAAVHETYSRIRLDRRHYDLVMISRAVLPQRDFANWSMGYRQVDAGADENFPEHAQFFDFKKQVERIRAKPGLALEMLKLFRNDMM